MSVIKRSIVEQLLDLLAHTHRDPASGRDASDYRLSIVLGVSRQAISNYRKGGSYFDDEVAHRLAEQLGMDPAYIMALAHAERSDGDVQKTWRRVAEKFAHARKVAALAVAAIALGGPTPPAGGAAVAAENGALAVYYVKRRRQLHSARGWLDSLTGTLRRLAASLAPFPGVFAPA